jgi:hypothetical protein
MSDTQQDPHYSEEAVKERRARFLAREDAAKKYEAKLNNNAEKLGLTREEYNDARYARALVYTGAHALLGNPYARDLADSLPLSKGFNISSRALEVNAIKEKMNIAKGPHDLSTMATIMGAFAKADTSVEGASDAFKKGIVQATSNILKRQLIRDLGV